MDGTLIPFVIPDSTACVLYHEENPETLIDCVLINSDT